MKIEIELTEVELRKLVYDHILSLMGEVKLEERDIAIEVKTKQNYKAEWESGQFRARVAVNR